MAPRREDLFMRGGVGCDVQTGAQNIRIWSEKEEKVVAPRRDGLILRRKRILLLLEGRGLELE